jgi:hypothetical protein
LGRYIAGGNITVGRQYHRTSTALTFIRSIDIPYINGRPSPQNQSITGAQSCIIWIRQGNSSVGFGDVNISRCNTATCLYLECCTRVVTYSKIPSYSEDRVIKTYEITITTLAVENRDIPLFTGKTSIPRD